MATSEQLSRIQNIIIVMMENRSFDHALGYLSLQDSGYPNWNKIEGVRQAQAQNYLNTNPEGDPVAPHPIDLFWNAAEDPPHERPFVKTQLGTPSSQGVFPMNGFVQAYYDANRQSVETGVCT